MAKLKIWITEIGEPLPFEGRVRLHRYGLFSRYLAQQGHDVTWWTSTFSHAPKKHLFDEDRMEMWEGVKVRLLHGPGYSRNVSVGRIMHQRHFAKRFVEEAEKLVPPDIVISPIPTLEVASKAVDYGLRHGVPVMTDIRDFWPDEFANIAPAKLRFMARAVLKPYYRMAEFICGQATGIMGICDTCLDYGLSHARRARGENDLFFPLGYSLSQLESVSSPAVEDWYKGLGIGSDAFVGCFFGTIGRFFDLGTVIEGAKRLNKEFPFRLILAGDGSSLERFKAQAAGSDSVIFPGWVNAEQIAVIMRHAHFGLAPYAEDAAMALPNKPFEYMAGRLPIVSSIQGQLKNILSEHDCGLTYRASSVDEFCVAIRELRKDEQRRKQMGENARSLLEQRFESTRVFAMVENHLENIVQRSKEASSKPAPGIELELV